MLVPASARGSGSGVRVLLQREQAPIAQWLEQRAYTSSVPDKHMVLGSNPSGGTGDGTVRTAMLAGSPEAGAASGDPVVLAEPVSQGTPTQGAPDGARTRTPLGIGF